MSDPASKSESDAVLTSIRRMLLNRTDEQTVPSDDTPPAPLLLTEAQRVDAAATTPPAVTSGAPRDPGAALDWRDEADRGPPEALSEPGGAASPRDLPAGNVAAALEDTVVDEEFLRDIVSEIVRDELQGELGERITRNVRKLVRREINRALASRDLD